MHQPIVLLDLDGVVFDFFGAARRVCAEVGHDLVAKSHDFTDDLHRDHRDVWRHYVRRTSEPGFCYGIPFYDDLAALGFVEALQELGDVVAVTSPLPHSPHWHHERLERLCGWGGIQRDDVVFTARKDLVFGDVLVEDNPENLSAWWRRWGRHHAEQAQPQRGEQPPAASTAQRCVLVGHDYNVAHAGADWYVRHPVGDYASVLSHVRGLL